MTCQKDLRGLYIRDMMIIYDDTVLMVILTIDDTSVAELTHARVYKHRARSWTEHRDIVDYDLATTFTY